MFFVRNQRLWISLAGISTVHLLLLFIPWSETIQHQSTSLKIRLNPAQTTEQLPEPIKDVVVNPEPELEPEPISQPNEEPKPNLVAELKSPDQSIDVPPKYQLKQIVSRPVVELRFNKEENEKKFSYRNFSGLDFSTNINRTRIYQRGLNQTEAAFKRPSHISLLISSNSNLENSSDKNLAGQSTDLVRGTNGKSMCWQQRGIPGETQRWYRVPLALCGHLK